ncbi:MAG: SMP-30/gluconolactonase/LRE family protein, partial [Serratia proteamaculans]
MFQNTVSSTSPLRFGGITLLVSFVLFFAAAAPTQGAQVITFVPDVAGGYPESIAWNEHAGAFLVSSLRGGQIGLVYEDGRYRRFAVGRSQITTSGIVVDAVRNRVLVCNEDVGIALKSSPGTRNRVAQVLEFDLDTGALQHIYDFSPLSKGSTLANDLTIDAQGNVYVTDSFQPQIYKIDQKTKAVSILVRSERLMPVTTTAASGAKPYL